MPSCLTSSVMVKPREGWAVRNERISVARVAAGAGLAIYSV